MYRLFISSFLLHAKTASAVVPDPAKKSKTISLSSLAPKPIKNFNKSRGFGLENTSFLKYS